MSGDGSYMTGKDILLLPDGSTYHLGAKAGDVYPRIITVGDHERALKLSTLLDEVEKTVLSKRMFHIYSGKYKGVGVSIIAIGMGAPMMDFLVRESSFICPGPMAIIRIGTCGLFNPVLTPGTVVVASKGCCCSYINHSAFTGGLIDGSSPAEKNHYLITNPVKGDAELNDFLYNELVKEKVPCHNGLNVAADTFFACQGRQDTHFDNMDNTTLCQSMVKHGVDSCEMESFTLYQLAKQRTIAPLRAAACHIGILNRVNPGMIDNITKQQLDDSVASCGRAALEALIKLQL